MNGETKSNLPRACEILVEQTPRPAKTPRRFPPKAPVEVCMYRYTKHAADLWPELGGQDTMPLPLFQVQIAHAAQRNITYLMRESFQDFLHTARKTNDKIPLSMQDLDSKCGVRLIVTDGKDPDKVGYHRWRVAFYCTDLSNFLLLLDGWFRFKSNPLDPSQPFQVVLHPHVGIDISSVWDELGYATGLEVTMSTDSVIASVNVFHSLVLRVVCSSNICLSN